MMQEPSGAVTRVARLALVWLLPLYPLVPRFPIAGPIGSDDIIPLVAVGLAALSLALRRRMPRRDLVLTLLLAFAGVASLAAAILAHGGVGLLVALGRTSGRLVMYAVLIVAVRELLDAPSRRLLLMSFLAVAAFEGAFGVVAYAARFEGPWQTGMLAYPKEALPESGRTRVQGTFGGAIPPGERFLNRANFYSAYLVMVLMGAGALVLDRRRNYRTLGAAALIVGGILVSYSRMSLLAAVAGFGVLALLRRRFRALVPLAAVVVLLAAVSPALRERFLATDTDRAGQWLIATRVIAQHPGLGVGDGRYLEEARAVSQGVDVLVVRTPHNSVLYAAASYGIAAGLMLVALYLGLVVDAVRRFLRRKTPSAAARVALVTAFLVHDLTNNLFFIPEVALAFWALWAATDEADAP